MTVHNCCMGRDMSLKAASCPMVTTEYVVHWSHPSPYSKHHVDRFSGFVGLTVATNKRTHTHTVTHMPRYICNNWPHLHELSGL